MEDVLGCIFKFFGIITAVIIAVGAVVLNEAAVYLVMYNSVFTPLFLSVFAVTLPAVPFWAFIVFGMGISVFRVKFSTPVKDEKQSVLDFATKVLTIMFTQWVMVGVSLILCSIFL
jgi:hypothetical protein